MGSQLFRFDGWLSVYTAFFSLQSTKPGPHQ
jgi:hypothetical protein